MSIVEFSWQTGLIGGAFIGLAAVTLSVPINNPPPVGQFGSETKGFKPKRPMGSGKGEKLVSLIIY